ncbi:MAG: prolyl oligopeptidase family serine peptidase [Gammaproteobacteria bacterium]|nr:prolyl oligopeptidase family serine peptidase [Gammaproteobacteria bacterium]
MKQLVMILCISLGMVSNGWCLETITFLSEPGSHSPFRLKLAKSKGIDLEPREKIELTGYLGKPDTEIPSAAVILLHSGLGLQDFHKEWAQRLAEWGYVSLLIFSAAPAGVEVPASINLSGDVISNAYGAYEYLKKQPHVDSRRIGIMGWSAGGNRTFSLIGTDPPAGRKTSKAFSAAAIIYPVCNPQGGAFTTPMLILLGDNDRFTQKGHCRLFKQGAENSNSRQVVELKVYPGATHFYDDPRYPAYTGNEVTAGDSAYYYDPEAHRDSLNRVQQFFKKYLGQKDN